jgi:glycosyltransferase involved in cell wall biosynthesis
MLISIGIMAWNEENVIERTLISLFEQSVFSGVNTDLPEAEWEIIVVPNGCSDRTAEIAHRTLAMLIQRNPERMASFAVREISESGKSNAWNRYVHEFSNSRADLMVLIDADIEFGERETIANAVRGLIANPEASVAVDLPLKDAVKKPHKSLLETISLAGSESLAKGVATIAGSFYCARAHTLREIWMPKGLSGEDGFLRAMVLTDCFRSAINERRIIRVANATHYYETLTSLKNIFRHELRLVIGTATNCYLTWDFLAYAVDPKGPGAGVLIRNRLEENPLWYQQLLDNSIKNHGFWVLPRGMLLRRFAKRQQGSRPRTVKQMAMAVIGFLLDVPVFLVANQKLKKGDAVGFW